MLPANPPLPSPRYFPFQPDAGSHTSNSMCESLDGWITPCTRQNAGSAFQAASAGPFGGGAPGGVKAPAATTCAAVKVVFASFKLARLSQLAATTGDRKSVV